MVSASSVDETDQGFLARRRAARGAALFRVEFKGHRVVVWERGG
jgi:hypothetical protein